MQFQYQQKFLHTQKITVNSIAFGITTVFLELKGYLDQLRILFT